MALTTFNDNVQVNANKALDNRLGKYSGSKWVPYASIAEANSYISSSYRYVGLTVPVGTTSSFTYYIYTGNLADSDLVPLTSSYATTASYAFINSGSFATTGSNLFIGTEIITGSLSVNSGTNQYAAVVEGDSPNNTWFSIRNNSTGPTGIRFAPSESTITSPHTQIFAPPIGNAFTSGAFVIDNLKTGLQLLARTGDIALMTVGFGYTNNAYYRLIIKNNGNVLIGTAADSGHMLNLNGTAQVQGKLTVTTNGIQVTGSSFISQSLTVNGPTYQSNAPLYFTTGGFANNTRIYLDRDGAREGLVFKTAGTGGGFGSKFEFIGGSNLGEGLPILRLYGTSTTGSYQLVIGHPSGSSYADDTGAKIMMHLTGSNITALSVFNNASSATTSTYFRFSNVFYGGGAPSVGAYLKFTSLANNYGGDIALGTNPGTGPIDESDLIIARRSGTVSVVNLQATGSSILSGSFTVTGSINLTGSLNITTATSSFISVITNTKDTGGAEHGIRIALQNGGSSAYYLQGWNTPSAAERFRIDAGGTLTTSGSITFISGSSGILTAVNKIYWSNDADGYIWAPADGTFAVLTNNTERYRVTSNGNILVGTTAEATNTRINVVGGGIKVTGTGTTSTTKALDVYNSTSPSASFSVFDDQGVYIRNYISFGSQGSEPVAYPLLIKQAWGGTIPAGINIGTFNGTTSVGANTGSYVVIGHQNTFATGSSIIIGTQNTTTGSALNTLMYGVSNLITASLNVQGGTAGAGQILIGFNNTTNQYTNSNSPGIFIGQSNFNNGYFGGGLIGAGLKYYANNQLAFGANTNSVDFAVKEVYFGNGVRNEFTSVNANNGNGPNVSINVSQAATASVTSRTGGTLTLRGGQGTGSGSAGDVVIATPVSRSTDDSTHHTYLNRMWIQGHTGNVGIGAVPTHSLDVSGSARFRISTIISGSLMITGSTIITGSFAITGSGYITGSLAVGTGSVGAGEHTLIVGVPPAGGAGEGGQILLAPAGGLYTTASMIDNYQNKFRVLRGTSAGSDGYKFQVDMHTGQLQAPNYNAVTAFPGTPVGYLAVDSNGFMLTTPNGLPSGSATATAGATTTILTLPTGSYRAGFFDYTVFSGTNARAGVVASVWNGSNVQFSDTPTTSIGSTADITVAVTLSGANALFRATTAASSWTVRVSYRLI